MKNYSILKTKKFALKNMKLISLREEDIEKIRTWRNQQRSILRQNKIITKKEQENYFNTVIVPTFEQKEPEIILFSILQKGKCIGYGGLVHINWKSKRGEISFVTETKRSKSNLKLKQDFETFLEIILNIGFNILNLNKITTETFEFRKNILNILTKKGFVNEGTLQNHVYKNGTFHNSILHCFFKEKFTNLIDASEKNILFTSISQKATTIEQLKNSTKYNVNIFGINSDFNCVGKFFVDKFWKMPLLENLEITKLIKFCKKNKINYIIPSRDGDLAYFAKNKSLLQKNKIFVMVSSLKTINTCLDKISFYKHGKKSGLPIIHTSKNIEEINSKKYVVKERFGSGSKLIGLNLSKTNAQKYKNMLENPIFQAYISGEEFSIDAYVTKKGKPQGIVIRKRKLIVNGESKISNVVRNKKLELITKKLIKSFNFSGHIVLQVLVDSKNCVHILECNARFGGASTLSIVSGLDSFTWFIKECLDQKLGKQVKISNKTLIRYSKDMFIN